MKRKGYPPSEGAMALSEVKCGDLGTVPGMEGREWSGCFSGACGDLWMDKNFEASAEGSTPESEMLFGWVSTDSHTRSCGRRI